MANQITDNRTQVDPADATTNYDDLGGVSGGNLDSPPEAFIQGGASIGEIISNTINGILFDAGSAQDWSSNVFYIWINCGVVGLLDIKANAGFTIRFCGATVTDWFEVYVGGSDSWPAAVQGGWVQFVIDIEDARAAAIVGTVGGVNGTTPATSAIRYVGWSGITSSVMTKMVDNTWIDEIRRLPDGSPGIIVEGRNGGSTDWNSADIASELGIAVGTFIQTTGGAYKINTPIQFGIDDTSTHAFTDTNAIWLWSDEEFAPSDLYGMSAIGNSGGTTNVTFGVKTGSGDAATGAQGLIMSANAASVRWSMDFDDPDLDGINFYGSTLIHGSTLQLDDPAVSFISTQYIDCTSALIANSEQLRVAVIEADTADGVAFMITDDMADIVFSDFQFSDGHAIELNAATPTSQVNKGNLFSGYTNSVDSTDAAILNSAAGALTISSSNGSNLGTNSYRNTGGGSVSIQSTVTLNVTVKDDVGVALEDVIVSIRDSSDNSLVSQGRTTAAGLYSDATYNYGGDLAVTIEVRKSSPGDTRYFPKSDPATIESTGMSVTVAMVEDQTAGIIVSTIFDISKHGQISNDVSGSVITAKIKLPFGSRRKLVVAGLYWDSTANRTVSSFTFDGNAMADTGGGNFVQEGSEFHEVFLYRYDIPDSDVGTKDIVLTLSGVTPFRAIAFAVINLAATGAEEDDGNSVAQASTGNPSISLNNTTQPAIDIMFSLTDDLDTFPPAATGEGSLRRADRAVDTEKQITIIRADRVATGAHNIGCDYDASSKTYVSAAATFAD